MRCASTASKSQWGNRGHSLRDRTAFRTTDLRQRLGDLPFEIGPRAKCLIESTAFSETMRAGKMLRIELGPGANQNRAMPRLPSPPQRETTESHHESGGQGVFQRPDRASKAGAADSDCLSCRESVRRAMRATGLYRTKMSDRGAEYARVVYRTASPPGAIPRPLYEARGYAPPFDEA
jgi:hypothetical protein